MEKMRQWMVLTALGVVGVLAAGWFLLVSPQGSHASSLRSQAAAEQQSTAGVQSQVAQLKQQQKGEPAQQQRLAEIAAQIPNNPELPTLIRQLSAAAHDAGVSLDSLSPSQPTSVAVTAPTTSATGVSAAGVSAAASPLEQVPVTLTVTGSYFNVENFMHALEHLDRAMMTTGLTLAPASATADSATSKAPSAVTGQIQAVVFESPDVAPATTTPQVPTAAAPSAAPSTTTPAQSGSSE